MKKIAKYFLRFLAAVLLLVVGASLYVNQFPQTVSRFVPPLIEAALKETPYQLEFEKAEIEEVSLDGTVSLVMAQLSVLGEDGQVMVSVPEAVVEANFWSGLFGASVVERVTLEKAQLVLVRKADGEIVMSAGAGESLQSSEVPEVSEEEGQGQSLKEVAKPITEIVEEHVVEEIAEENTAVDAPSEDEVSIDAQTDSVVEEVEAVSEKNVAEPVAVKETVAEPLNAQLVKWLEKLPHRVALREANITMIDEAEQTNVQWQDVSFSLTRGGAEAEWKGVGRAALQLPQGHALLTLNAKVESNGDADIEVEFDALDVASICAIQPRLCGDVAQLSLPLSGEIHLLVSEAALPTLRFALQKEAVQVAHPVWFPQGAEFAHYDIAVDYLPVSETVLIEKVALGIGEGEMIAEGQLSVSEAAPSAQAKLGVTRLPLALLKQSWPIGVAHDAREWVVNNMPVGMIETAEAQLNLSSEQWLAGAFPKEAFSAKAKLQGVEVHYLPDYPHVEQVNGEAEFDAQSMIVRLTGGKTLSDTVLEEGEVHIPDFSAPGVPMEIDLLLNASAADVATFINAPHYTFAKPLTLNPKTISGRANGKVALKFNTSTIEPDAVESEGGAPKESAAQVQAPKEEMGEVFYDIQAELHKLSQQKVKGRWDFRDVDASIQADATGVAMKGVGKIHGVTSRFTVEDRIGKPTRYSFKGKVPKAKFGLFDLPDSEMVSGWADVDADVTLLSSKHQRTKLSLGLKDAEISVPSIGWVKPQGEGASFMFKADSYHGGETRLSDMNFTSDRLSLSGSGEIAEGMEIRSLALSELRTGDHTISVNLSKANGTYDIRAKGQGLNLAALESEQTQNDKVSGGTSISHLPPLKLSLDMKSLVLDEGAALTNVNAQLDCRGVKGRCESANLSALLPKKEALVARIYRDAQGVRRLKVETDDGAGLVKLLGIHDEIEGGKLSIRGEYLDGEAGAPLEGRLEMEKFTLRNAPILSKLLSLGSFTGMMDTLQGKGLNFDKLVSKFRFADDVMEIENSQLKGNTLGATLSGTIDIAKHHLNLKGSLLPSYFLNTLINNVPVIGDLITGGEGEGLVGVRYSVKGNASEPELSVNPLSALTPGFTRGIFDAFESDEPVDETEEDARKRGRKKGTGTALNQ